MATTVTTYETSFKVSDIVLSDLGLFLVCRYPGTGNLCAVSLTNKGLLCVGDLFDFSQLTNPRKWTGEIKIKSL